MPTRLSEAEAVARRDRIVAAARWCFLHFGFAKTTFDDVAKRAGLSRTLLYRTFRDKEALYTAVFADWLVARHPLARRAAEAAGDAGARLRQVCRILVLEPWADMVGAPMAGEFFDACARIDPAVQARHGAAVRECAATILGDAEIAAVFALALDGLLADDPAPPVLERRVALLVERFAPAAGGAP